MGRIPQSNDIILLKFKTGEILTGTPPMETAIIFRAGEFGQPQEWYPGFCFQSSLPGQETQFYIFPWFFGFPLNNPCFHAPPYLGEYAIITDSNILNVIYEYYPLIKKDAPKSQMEQISLELFKET